jgi:hypothetical protein
MKDYALVAAPWRPLLRHLLRRLNDRGLSVSRTFDLQVARRRLKNSAEAPCPHHGSDRCTCQYLVLRIGRRGFGCISVVVHGHDSVTKITMLTEASGKPGGGIVAEVRQELAKLLSRRAALT